MCLKLISQLLEQVRVHNQLVVKLNVHDVAKAIASIRFRLVSIVGISDGHLGV